VGSGGLLIKCHLLFRERYDDDSQVKPLKFYGQEILPNTYAMANMNVFIHNMEAEIALGDTMNHPAFTDERGALKRFDIVVSNPMWNQDFPQTTYENDTYGRFTFGYPPSSSADWGWVQHMYSSLKDKGRLAVVLDTGSVSRGSGSSGSNRERDIRKRFVDSDLVEAVILLPENLFYNTSAPGIIMVINKNKAPERSSQVLLINASKLFEKGRPKNFLPDSTIELVSGIYHDWREQEGISKIVSTEDVAKNDYNLSPSRYVAQNGNDDVLPLDEAVLELKEAEEELQEVDRKLQAILKELMGL
jgi:type I restriction enzyme M protein